MAEPVHIHGAGVAGMLAAFSLNARGVKVMLWHNRSRRAAIGWEVVDDAFPVHLREIGVGHLWSALTVKHPVRTVTTAWSASAEYLWETAFRPSVARWAIERSELEERLWSEIEARPNIARRTDRARNAHPFAGFMIDATGRAAAVARIRGARSRPIAELVGLVARGVGKALDVPIVEACVSGWWFLSGTAVRANAIYFTDGKRLGNTDSVLRTWNLAFADTSLMRHHFVPDKDEPIKRTAASSRFLDPSCGSDWVAIGDAALTQDPLSSDGLGFAARSALLLQRCWRPFTFDSNSFAREIGLEIARYRIARQRYYEEAADRFGSAFWIDRANLPLPAS